MPKSTVLLLLAALLASPISVSADEPPVAIAIHAGAGTIERHSLDTERETAIRQALADALGAGHAVLVEGGTSLEAVRVVVNRLEDSPFFNAGKGAVFNAEGEHELDASIMDGATLEAGAVAGVSGVPNPIDLAWLVMTESRHVLLVGEGAEHFAREQGIEFEDPEYFHTDYRWQQLRKAQAAETAGLGTTIGWYSTVGAVALDRAGNLAAGTSTGGVTNKRWGRVGDTPIIGAGNYANNKSCAVSATGTGEFFIRHVVAYSICEGVRGGRSVAEAAGHLIHEVLAPINGSGGVIAMDAEGNIAMPHNTPGMYRASIDTAGRRTIAIFADETTPH